MAMFGGIGKALGLGKTPKILNQLAPLAGAAAGSLLLPGVGTALGSSLGAGVGAAAGKAATGGKLKDDILAGVLAGGGEYLSEGANGQGFISNTSHAGADAIGAGGMFPSSTAAASGGTGLTNTALATDPSLAAGGGTAAATGVNGLTDTSLAVDPSLAAQGTAQTATAVPGSTSLLGKAGDFLSNNKGVIAQLAPVALTMAESGQKTTAEKALEQQAATQKTQSDQLLSTLNQGKLPQGLQDSFDQALQANIAQIKSDYAAKGLSGSSMEQQAIQGAEQASASQRSQEIQKMISQGLSEADASSKLYSDLMQSNIQSDQNLSEALARAVGAMGGYNQPSATTTKVG